MLIHCVKLCLCVPGIESFTYETSGVYKKDTISDET